MQYRVIPIEIAEVTSIIGNITLYNGEQVTHSHATAAIADGSVKGGHLLKLISGPTIEIVITTEPTPLLKKMNTEFNALMIDATR